MRNPEDIVYSINVEDLQNVAEQELGRALTDNEIQSVARKVGDFIDWYGVVVATLAHCLRSPSGRAEAVPL